MFNRFMVTAAAAALIAGTGFASAQGTGGSREAPSAGTGMQQSAPSSPSATPMNRESGGEQGVKSSQSEEKMHPQGGKNQRAQEGTKAGAKDEKSAQDSNIRSEKSKGMSSQNEKGVNEKGAAGKEMKAEGREDRSGNMKAEGREDRNGMKAEGREGRDGMKAEGRNGNVNAEGRTVGQAGAGAKLTTEQRTRITTVIRGQHVAPVNNVNFAISVGTRVPREIGFHPLPAEIVTIYPEWRGYEFFLVGDQIVVVDPRTFEIVAVLEA
ncbi:MAG: DUF1236 domain-containing protein [Bradyrhizobium sp.]